jgi:hypothetical protein
MVALPLGGCGFESPSAASSEYSTATYPPGDLEQLASAERLSACFEEHGIVPDWAELQMEGRDGVYYSVMPGPQTTSFWVNGPGARGQATEDFRGGGDIRYGDTPIFFDGGVDRSAEYAACLESSGYFFPRPSFPPEEEAPQKRAVAEASNDWAACARRTGYSDVVDAEVRIDGWETSPYVTIPGTITEEQLRAILDECPYVSAQYRESSLGPDDIGYDVQPDVLIDLPPRDPKLLALWEIMNENLRGILPPG